MLGAVRRTLGRIGGGVVGEEEAEDVVQSFLVACIEHDYLAKADAQIGRFRTFVAVCLRRHTTKYVEHRRRKRRSPESPVRSLDASDFEVADHDLASDWDAAFEEEWVRCLLGAALPRVGKRSRPNEELLRLLYAAPHLDITDVALRLGVDRTKIPLRLHRARKMLAEEFWEVVKQTVSDDRQLEEERSRVSKLLEKHLEVQHAPSLFG
jgi:RNA polymerase sigma factor (sigma-70 family)